ncbi:MAG: DNA mismatch repair protein MutS, partial [Armatimonadetes bacterium CG07_land_8_20_14_0_80_40_9]
QSLRDRKRFGTLLDLLDETCTSMGARLLRQFVEQPLLDIKKIKLRQEGVFELVNNTFLRADLRGELKKIQDLERLLGKIVYGTANARDLIALKNSLKALPTIKEVLAKVESNILRQSLERLDELSDIFSLIERSINDEPPLTIREGNLIKEGFNQEVDRLRQAGSEGKVWMTNLEAKEREKTGIKSLKVGFTSVFGYYIEVTKPNLHLVPPDYTRKQTTANAERFVTSELKEKESLILGAEEKIVVLEYELFLEVRKQVASQSERIQTSAKIIAFLDVLSSLAEVALDNNYVKPEIVAGDEILIYDGRHPVIEKVQQDERFVPNDARLDNRENQLLILTGPNMAGKSTYLRQVALIVLMAQMGSFIPAKEAKIGLVDRIFTRVGARDDLAFGQSTFMMEMNEVANILHNATSKSLIVLDEIGRGTSTFDGLSIAWAVAEYIHNQKRIAAKTLFATHFHELTKLSETLPRVKNYNVAVKEEGDEVIFLRKIIPGGADRSYGIHVARLAGLPWEVLNRAKVILQEMEDKSIDSQRLSSISKRPEVRRKEETSPGQLSFLKPTFDPLKKELEDLDINSLTPLEALNKLSELQKKVKGKEEEND